MSLVSLLGGLRQSLRLSLNSGVHIGRKLPSADLSCAQSFPLLRCLSQATTYPGPDKIKDFAIIGTNFFCSLLY